MGIAWVIVAIVLGIVAVFFWAYIAVLVVVLIPLLMMRAGPARIVVVLSIVWAAVGCDGPPDSARAIADFNATSSEWEHQKCIQPEVFSDRSNTRDSRQFGIRADCAVNRSAEPRRKYFNVEYSFLGGGWDLRGAKELPLAEIEARHDRTTASAPQEEATADSFVPVLVLAIPVAISVALLLVFSWVLRSRQRDRADRPAGAGIIPRGVGPKPLKIRHHWTINKEE